MASGRGYHAQAAPHTHQPPSGNSQKTASPQSHISQATHCSPCLADPHTGHVLIRFRGSPIPLTSSKKSDPDSDETSVTVPQIQPPQIPCTCDLRRGVAWYHRYGRTAIVPPAWLHGYSRVPYPARPAKMGHHKPAETSGRSTQIHASNRSTQIPSNDRSTQMHIRPTHSNSLRRRGGHGRRRRGVAATSTTGGGGGQHLCSPAIGPKGPITVKPEGLTDLRAGQMVGPEGSTEWSGLKPDGMVHLAVDGVTSSSGLPTGALRSCVACAWLTLPVPKVPANKRAPFPGLRHACA